MIFSHPAWPLKARGHQILGFELTTPPPTLEGLFWAWWVCEGLSNRLDCLHIQLCGGGEGFIIYRKHSSRIKHTKAKTFKNVARFHGLCISFVSKRTYCSRVEHAHACRSCCKLNGSVLATLFITSLWPLFFVFFWVHCFFCDYSSTP